MRSPRGGALEQQSGGRLRLVQAPFSTLDEHVESADGVVLDIGVSSMQIDQAERGFSFRADGPLDMRMAQAGLSAADVVNRFKAGDLARIFGFLGEERHAGRIARMIEKRREERPFERTLDLADAIETHIGRTPKDKIHPATRVFQALRIFVNDELGELAQGAVRGRAGAEARRAACRGDVPFAGRPHRQALHRRPRRHRRPARGICPRRRRAARPSARLAAA